MSFLTEAEIEADLLSHLSTLGYEVVQDSVIGPDGASPERDAYADAVLYKKLKAAVDRINPAIPELVRIDAIKKLLATDKPVLIEENRRLHKALVEGVPVEFYAEDGTIRGGLVHFIDFHNSAANNFLAVQQFSFVENGHNRRPDIVLFVNGLPLGLIELKKPGVEADKINEAYNQLQTYKAQLPSLLRFNAVLVISDGLSARIGSLSADRERFMPWRTVDGNRIESKGEPELHTLALGVFEKERFLSLVRDFTLFRDGDKGAVKIIAGYHQFHAVHHAVVKTLEASAPDGDRRVGVPQSLSSRIVSILTTNCSAHSPPPMTCCVKRPSALTRAASWPMRSTVLRAVLFSQPFKNSLPKMTKASFLFCRTVATSLSLPTKHTAANMASRLG
jgi:type I restriction enzyme, R subunit